MPKMKTCTKCREEKPATTDYFGIKSKCKDGLRECCKICFSVVKKRYREGNKAKVADEKRKYDAENKDKVSERRKKYREANRERILAYGKKYYVETRPYEKNRDRVLIYTREWRKNNLDKDTGYRQKRRARKRELLHTFTVEQWLFVKDQFSNRCAYCGEEKPLEQDHFIPLSAGGEYTIANIIPACKSCNCSKHDASFFEWYPTYKHWDKDREIAILNHLGNVKIDTPEGVFSMDRTG